MSEDEKISERGTALPASVGTWKGLEASEPLCEMSGELAMGDPPTPEDWVIRRMPHGGFLVGTVPVAPGTVAVKFASTSVDEALEYLEDRFS